MVGLISLGGTITATAGASGVAPTATAADLAAELERTEMAHVAPVDLGTRPSGELCIDDVHDLVEAIGRDRAQGRAGTVVAIGSDALEEIAFGVDLLVEPGPPVVFTAAMRDRSALGSDGLANLSAATRVAGDPAAAGLGALVVLNDEVHAARLVRKAHTTALDAFASPGAGPLGRLREGELHLVAVPRLPRPALLDPDRSVPARVAALGCGIGDDGAVLGLLSAPEWQGAVIAGFGAGHVTPAYAAAIERAAESLTVVVSSRTGAGETLSDTYGTPGCEIDLQRRGAILAGPLDPAKARILLILGVQTGRGTDFISQLFDETTATAGPRVGSRQKGHME